MIVCNSGRKEMEKDKDAVALAMDLSRLKQTNDPRASTRSDVSESDGLSRRRTVHRWVQISAERTKPFPLLIFPYGK